MTPWFRAGHRSADSTTKVEQSAVVVMPEVVSSAEVVLLTRAGCHLCEQAEPTVEALCEKAGAQLAVVDVDSDPVVRQQFTDHVPVLFVRGRLLDYWRVDAVRLERALRGEAVEPPAAL